MATKPVSSNPWYPPNVFGKFEQDNALRIAFDHIYDLQSRFQELSGKHAELTGKMKDVSAENVKLKQIIDSQIAGHKVKTTLPQNGDTVRFNTQSQQFEFGA